MLSDVTELIEEKKQKKQKKNEIQATQLFESLFNYGNDDLGMITNSENV